jgi:hypothetical protein
MIRVTTALLCAVLVTASAGTLAAWQRAGGGDAQAAFNRVADAILRLKSARFTVTREGAPAFFDERNGIVFSLAECIYAAPDRASCNIKISFRNGVLQVVRVWVPEGTFQSNPLTQQFARLPPDATFNGSVMFARTGIPDVLRTSVGRPQVVGRERIGNREALHLRGEMGGEKLSTLIPTLSAGEAYPVDLWIDERSAVPQRFRISDSPGNGWLIDISGIDEPITIPTPQVPAPTGNP